MGCSKPSCGSTSGTSEINTDWCGDSSAGCTTCTPQSSCDSGNGSSTVIKTFEAVLKVDNSWIMPNCGGSAILSISCLTNILVGSYLWNEGYGYLRVVSYNPVTNKVTVQNDCLFQNAVPGTPVPAGTTFVVSDRPFDSPVSCTALTTALSLNVGTDSYTLTVGDSSLFSALQTLQINGRTDYFFRVTSVPNATQVQVTVYPPITLNEVIATGSSVCTYIPCENYEYRSDVSATSLAPLGSKVIQQTDQIFTSNAQNITVFNSSQCRTMEVQWTALGTVYAVAANALTYAFDIHLELLYAEDSGSYTSIADIYHTFHLVGNGNEYSDMQVHSTGVFSGQLAPQGSTTLHFKVKASYSGAGGSTSTYSISGSTIKVSTIAVNFDNS